MTSTRDKLASVEKLRTIARNMAKGRNLEHHEENNLLLTTADEIEREVSERFMELPVDMDGVPIHVGEKVAFRSDAPVTVTSIGMSQIYGPNDCGFYGSSGGFYGRGTLGDVRHVKPRTIEDVLRCRECAYYYEADNYHPSGNYTSRCCKYFDSYMDEVQPDGYCAWGERRKA